MRQKLSVYMQACNKPQHSFPLARWLSESGGISSTFILVMLLMVVPLANAVKLFYDHEYRGIVVGGSLN